MALTSGNRVGPYEILSAVSAGGTGEANADPQERGMHERTERA
jgi:hypothetical protein